MHEKYPPGIEVVTLGSLISDVPIIMLSLISNMKSRLMVGVAFVLSVPASSEIYFSS